MINTFRINVIYRYNSEAFCCGYGVAAWCVCIKYLTKANGTIMEAYKRMQPTLGFQPWQSIVGVLHTTIDILYTLDSASNYSAIQKLKP